jgi:hypothetical protein
MKTLAELMDKKVVLLRDQMQHRREMKAAKKDPIGGGVSAFLVAQYALDVANKSLAEVENQIKKLGS